MITIIIIIIKVIILMIIIIIILIIIITINYRQGRVRGNSEILKSKKLTKKIK